MLSRNLNATLRLSRAFSTQINPDVTIQSFRTPETNPLNHTMKDHAKFYSIEPNLCKTLFSHGGLPKSFMQQCKTFTETCLMVREPALEIMSLMNQSDLTKPVNRFVMYGEKGTGKTLTMAHAIHFAHLNNFLIVHVPWVPNWMFRTNRNKEMTNSTMREGFVDLPFDAAGWLIHFKQQNIKLLKDPNMIISNDYVWTQREQSKKGSLLLELVEFGITRIKFGSEVMVAIGNEIKLLSLNNVCKTFVAIDGFNCFFNEKTRLKTESKLRMPPNEVTLTIPMLELTKNDWNNGIVLTTVDVLADSNTKYDENNEPNDEPQFNYPRHLLRKEGFEHLDPFIPIEMKNYSEKEYINCTQYYRDRLWLRGPTDAEIELEFLSRKNPYRLMMYCAPL